MPLRAEERLGPLIRVSPALNSKDDWIVKDTVTFTPRLDTVYDHHNVTMSITVNIDKGQSCVIRAHFINLPKK
jgi:hypothetical protein